MAGKNQKLTNRQKTFARHIVEGIYSNTECARKAGYAADLANERAAVLLNGRDYPRVLEYIKDLREERERRPWLFFLLCLLVLGLLLLHQLLLVQAHIDDLHQ